MSLFIEEFGYAPVMSEGTPSLTLLDLIIFFGTCGFFFSAGLLVCWGELLLSTGDSISYIWSAPFVSEVLMGSAVLDGPSTLSVELVDSRGIA